MDIDPREFAPNQYVLADYVVSNKVDVLLFLTNWVDGEKDDITPSDITATYEYWINRLQPIKVSGKPVLFLAADRVGLQYDLIAKKKTMFYGSSCGISFNPLKILSNLDIKNEGYLIIDTFLD